MSPETLDGLPLRELRLPFRAREVSILLPQDPLALIPSDPGAPAVEIYWAELWPSALALAEMLLDGEVALPASGRAPVLELGCGAGLVAIATALAGARVVAADCEPKALALVRRNAERNGVAERVETLRVDWREPYTRRHPLVLAADCLYEPTAGAYVARFLDEALEPGTEAAAFVIDPERWSARHFHWTAREAGFEVQDRLRTVPIVKEQGPVREPARTDESGPQVRVYTLRRRPTESQGNVLT